MNKPMKPIVCACGRTFNDSRPRKKCPICRYGIKSPNVDRIGFKKASGAK